MLFGTRSLRSSLIQVCLKKWTQQLTAAIFISQTLRSSSPKEGSEGTVWQMKIWHTCVHYIVFHWCYTSIWCLLSYRRLDQRWSLERRYFAMWKCFFSSGFLTDPVCFVGSSFCQVFWSTRGAVRSQEVYADAHKQTVGFFFQLVFSPPFVGNVMSNAWCRSTHIYLLYLSTCI